MKTESKTKWVKVCGHVNGDHALFYPKGYPQQLSVCDQSGEVPDETDDGVLTITGGDATIEVHHNGEKVYVCVHTPVFDSRYQQTGRVMLSKRVFDTVNAHREAQDQPRIAVTRSKKAHALLLDLL